MSKTIYQTPATGVIGLEQEGVFCISYQLQLRTGASWALEDADSDEGFIL